MLPNKNNKVVKGMSTHLKNMRIIAGLKQTDVEELSGVSQAKISNYERGVQNPTIESFIKLLKVYKNSGVNFKHYIRLYPKQKRTIESMRLDTLIKRVEEQIKVGERVKIFDSQEEYNEWSSTKNNT